MVGEQRKGHIDNQWRPGRPQDGGEPEMVDLCSTQVQPTPIDSGWHSELTDDPLNPMDCAARVKHREWILTVSTL
jgi:hypothetical protein